MRIHLLFSLLLLLAPVLAAEDTPVYSGFYINPLDEKWREPVVLAEVTEYHACAGEPAYVNISKSPEPQVGQITTTTVRIDYLVNGTEQKVFEAVNIDTTYYPNGKLFQYFPQKEGEYQLVRSLGFAVLKRTFTIDCTYAVPVPPQPPNPLNCNDANACTADNEANGVCVHASIANGTICDANLVCISGVCTTPPMAPLPANESGQPGPVTKSDSEIAAFNAMENARYSIDAAQTAGADITSAQQWLDGARTSYTEGNFARAKELADEASSLAASAPRPPVSPAPDVPPAPSQPGNGFQLPVIALPSISLDFQTLSMVGIALVILAVVAFFIRARGSRGSGGDSGPKQPPQPPKAPENLSPEQLPSSMRPHRENENSS
ncbi:MAG: DUF4398 domain-containing protein [Candidatus Burarchaeum sp.]|nr:DUF4398 domain-containing protein [Candidatus Burarchaeum sp.]MDO8339422.1 DUF4398 domain-containing protein [Candidatus Burarchaeum sp.]